jgi:hypothetical protein
MLLLLLLLLLQVLVLLRDLLPLQVLEEADFLVDFQALWVQIQV